MAEAAKSGVMGQMQVVIPARVLSCDPLGLFRPIMAAAALHPSLFPMRRLIAHAKAARRELGPWALLPAHWQMLTLSTAAARGACTITRRPSRCLTQLLCDGTQGVGHGCISQEQPGGATCLCSTEVQALKIHTYTGSHLVLATPVCRHMRN